MDKQEHDEAVQRDIRRKRWKLRRKLKKEAEKLRVKAAEPIKKVAAVDPLWPEGASAQHLTRIQREQLEVVETIGDIREDDWKCTRCGTMTGTVDKKKPEYCRTCAAELAQSTALAQKINKDWMETSKELGLEIFERQPEETDTEWRIWQAYRGYYPLKLPTYSELSNITGHSVGTVTKAAQKWSYKIRLVEWSRYTDAGVQDKRIKAVREMNEGQLKMAKTINEKLGKAIQNIDPEALRPGEIVSLFKIATELERKITTYVEDAVVQPAIGEKDTKQQTMTKVEDLDEIVGILQKAGVFKGKQIGIEHATRIIVNGDEKDG